MSKKDYLIIKCNDEKCFKDTSKRLHCENCNKGKLYVKCWKCGEEHRVNYYFIRINCTCGANIFPCEYNSYKFVRLKKKSKIKRKVKKKEIKRNKKICENCGKKYYVSKGCSWQKYCCSKCRRQACFKRKMKPILEKRKAEKIREKQRISNHKRRTFIKNNGGHYTLSQIRKLMKDSLGICKGYNRKTHFVGKENLTIDHIKPISKRGSNFISNIQLLCKYCNISKGNKYNEK